MFQYSVLCLFYSFGAEDDLSRYIMKKYTYFENTYMYIYIFYIYYIFYIRYIYIYICISNVILQSPKNSLNILSLM